MMMMVMMMKTLATRHHICNRSVTNLPHLPLNLSWQITK